MKEDKKPAENPAEKKDSACIKKEELKNMRTIEEMVSFLEDQETSLIEQNREVIQSLKSVQENIKIIEQAYTNDALDTLKNIDIFDPLMSLDSTNKPLLHKINKIIFENPIIVKYLTNNFMPDQNSAENWFLEIKKTRDYYKKQINFLKKNFDDNKGYIFALQKKLDQLNTFIDYLEENRSKAQDSSEKPKDKVFSELKNVAKEAHKIQQERSIDITDLFKEKPNFKNNLATELEEILSQDFIVTDEVEESPEDDSIENTEDVEEEYEHEVLEYKFPFDALKKFLNKIKKENIDSVKIEKNDLILLKNEIEFLFRNDKKAKEKYPTLDIFLEKIVQIYNKNGFSQTELYDSIDLQNESFNSESPNKIKKFWESTGDFCNFSAFLATPTLVNSFWNILEMPLNAVFFFSKPLSTFGKGKTKINLDGFWDEVILNKPPKSQK